MTISISNLTVNNTASSGTVVGVLTARDASGAVVPCNFTLTKNSAGFLAISQVASGFLMEVNHGGQFYLNNSMFGWFVWNGTNLVGSAAP